MHYPHTPRNFSVENVTSRGAATAISAVSVAGAPLWNITVGRAKVPHVIKLVSNFPLDSVRLNVELFVAAWQRRLNFARVIREEAAKFSGVGVEFGDIYAEWFSCSHTVALTGKVS